MGTVSAIARKAKPRAPMETVDAVSVNRERGVEGDVRGVQKVRQVSVLFAEDWRAACAELFADIPWTTRRANFYVEGFPHAAEVKRVGAQLKIGNVLLEVTEETDPCGRMEEQVPGLRAALTPNWRGGICCKVVSDGHVKIGDKVTRA
jgi:MOSC domain-containing protein YiiM